MLAHLTVDTNVLEHSGNPENEFFAEALAFVEALLVSQTKICFDPPQPNISQPFNKSKIANEYLLRLSPVTLGYRVVVSLLSTGRLQLVEPDKSQAAHKQLKKLVPNNSRDLIFVKVALGSATRTLASHDFKDFPNKVRQSLSRHFGITIVVARVVTPQL